MRSSNTIVSLFQTSEVENINKWTKESGMNRTYKHNDDWVEIAMISYCIDKLATLNNRYIMYLKKIQKMEGEYNFIILFLKSGQWNNFCNCCFHVDLKFVWFLLYPTVAVWCFGSLVVKNGLSETRKILQVTFITKNVENFRYMYNRWMQNVIFMRTMKNFYIMSGLFNINRNHQTFPIYSLWILDVSHSKYSWGMDRLCWKSSYYILFRLSTRWDSKKHQETTFWNIKWWNLKTWFFLITQILLDRHDVRIIPDLKRDCEMLYFLCIIIFMRVEFLA